MKMIFFFTGVLAGMLVGIFGFVNSYPRLADFLPPAKDLILPTESGEMVEEIGVNSNRPRFRDVQIGEFLDLAENFREVADDEHTVVFVLSDGERIKIYKIDK